MNDTLLNAGGETSVCEVARVKSLIVDIVHGGVIVLEIEDFFSTMLLLVTHAVEFEYDVISCEVVLGVRVLFLGFVSGDVINSDFGVDRILLGCTINKSFVNSTFPLILFTLKITLLWKKEYFVER